MGMMKLLISACLVALALADAEPKADADPYYGYYGLGYHGLGYGLRAYGYGYPYAHGLLRILRPWLPWSWIPCLRWLLRTWPRLLRIRPRSVRILRLGVHPTQASQKPA